LGRHSVGPREVGCTLVDGTDELIAVNEVVWEGDVLGEEEGNKTTERKVRWQYQ